MSYTIEHISELVEGRFLNKQPYPATISNIIYDTRKVSYAEQSIFIALPGAHKDGHSFIPDAYKKGLRHFIVSKELDVAAYPEANFILCRDSLGALQLWAGHHRASLTCPTIAITGSNGKTIIKEWLAEALEHRYQVGKSPLSFNSQLGVALSVLQLESSTQLALIEAGISTTGEMSKLAAIIQPDLGILTNIGDAHSQGFSSEEEKLREKLLLFKDTPLILYCKDMPLVDQLMQEVYPLKTVSWGRQPDADIVLSETTQNKDNTAVRLQHGSEQFQLQIPFTNKDFCENALHVISYLILDNWSEKEIQTVLSRLSPLPNRLEIKKGINNCMLINDSYSLDLASLQLALEKMESLSTGKKIVFLSAFDSQNARPDNYQLLAELLSQKGIDELITIGMPEQKWPSTIKTKAYDSTESCLVSYNFDRLTSATILIKGARKYKLERLFNELAEQVHQTTLETNLSAITHNLNFYRKHLESSTKLMAVVKAEAYGSGSTEMVRFLEEQKVAYLGVALIDEAIQLRKKACRLPIMIFNIQTENLTQLWNYELEPEVYSFPILKKLLAHAQQLAKPLKIHLKIDTGMHRLGFLTSELDDLVAQLRAAPYLEIASIFSHLAGSESAALDAFTQEQFVRFEMAYDKLVAGLDLENKLPLKHILNSAGILRFPTMQYDMVRLGLGLYGIDEAGLVKDQLTKAHTLKAKVLQLKPLKKGQTTGYSRSGKAEKDTTIAVISIGYGDGLLRNGGNGNLQFQIRDQRYPTIGNICMDVTMIDLGSETGVQLGDDVMIFGPELPLEDIAKACNTITYEIISRLAPRIKRSYIYE